MCLWHEVLTASGSSRNAFLLMSQFQWLFLSPPVAREPLKMIHVTRKRNHVAPRGGRRLDRQSLWRRGGAWLVALHYARPGSASTRSHCGLDRSCAGKPITDPACGCSLGLMVYASGLRHSWPSNRRLWTASCGLHVLFHLLMSRIWEVSQG